jgi:hypothetical protein
MNVFTKKIYVDIDSLVDLRQGLLSLINQDASVEITSKPSYYLRTEDVFVSPTFGALSKDLYEQLRTSYKNEIMEASVATRMIEFIRELLLETWRDNSREGTKMNIVLEVNIRGHSLSLTAAHALQKTILESLTTNDFGHSLEVHIADFQVSELTLKKVRKEYLAAIMYDHVGWLETLKGQFANPVQLRTMLNNFTIYAPRLFYKPPNMETLSKIDQAGMDPFEFWSQGSKTLYDVVFLPTAFFCAATPANKSAYTVRA